MDYKNLAQDFKLYLTKRKKLKKRFHAYKELEFAIELLSEEAIKQTVEKEAKNNKMTEEEFIHSFEAYNSVLRIVLQQYEIRLLDLLEYERNNKDMLIYEFYQAFISKTIQLQPWLLEAMEATTLRVRSILEYFYQRGADINHSTEFANQDMNYKGVKENKTRSVADLICGTAQTSHSRTLINWILEKEDLKQTKREALEQHLISYLSEDNDPMALRKL